MKNKEYRNGVKRIEGGSTAKKFFGILAGLILAMTFTVACGNNEVEEAEEQPTEIVDEYVEPQEVEEEVEEVEETDMTDEAYNMIAPFIEVYFRGYEYELIKKDGMVIMDAKFSQQECLSAAADGTWRYLKESMISFTEEMSKYLISNGNATMFGVSISDADTDTCYLLVTNGTVYHDKFN